MITPSRPPVTRRRVAIGVTLAVAAGVAIAVWRWFGHDAVGDWGQIVLHLPSVGGGAPDVSANAVARPGATPVAPAPPPALAGVPRFTTSLARGLDGALWVGSEDDGIRTTTSSSGARRCTPTTPSRWRCPARYSTPT
ncbi:MAG: hypothetical protein JWM57_3823 [Phycisphaerales bacterium]|nr:hypothetical protein [Phycisphaerales bacterium]